MKTKIVFSLFALLFFTVTSMAQEKNGESGSTVNNKNVFLISNRWEITMLKAYNIKDGIYNVSFNIRDSKFDPQADEERIYNFRILRFTSEKGNEYGTSCGFTGWNTLFQDKPQKKLYELRCPTGAPANIKKITFVVGELALKIDGVSMTKPFQAEIDLDVE
jgi:hypothetical protein